MQLSPGGLEALGQLALGPALGQDYPVPELMQPGKVAAIETDRELAVVGGVQESGEALAAESTAYSQAAG
jgi:hypothetical protein